MKDCTSIEQGRMLVELGINPDTADKCWIAVGDASPVHYSLSLEQARENMMTVDKFLADIAKEKHPDALVPSWSLTALLAIINERFYTTLFHDGVAWNIKVIDHDNPEVKERVYDNYPVNACVKLIFLLKENGQIPVVHKSQE